MLHSNIAKEIVMKKALGATLLIIGTTIGAGMLGIPLTGGLVGFKFSTLIITLLWLLMTYTGLLVLEVNLTLPLNKNSFSSMAQQTAGLYANIITMTCVFLLLYSLTGAYISGDTSLLSSLTNQLFHASIPNYINSILFTFIFGFFIWHSTKAADHINQLFISAKGIFIILTLGLLLPKIHFSLLNTTAAHSPSNIWLVAPIFITSFGYHTVIPSITNYIGKNGNLSKKIIITGTTIPLIIYILWLLAVTGLIPKTGSNSFTQISGSGSVAKLVTAISLYSHSEWVKIAINGFANIAMVTSFLGVTLGLFDFIADLFNFDNSKIGRLKTAAATFLPPLFFSFIYPNGFILALAFAAIFVTILEVILPAWMCIKLRKKNHALEYKAPGNNFVLYCVMLVGVVIIALSIGSFY
jgi:tyrosine-specific transport protein